MAFFSLERCLRRFVEDAFRDGMPPRDPPPPFLNEQGQVVRLEFLTGEFTVIPGNSRGPRPLPGPPKGPYASLLLIEDQRNDYPIRRQMPGGMTIDMTYRRATYSLQFYRDGSTEFARAFDAWAMSENGLTYAETAFSDGKIVKVVVYEGGEDYEEDPDNPGPLPVIFTPDPQEAMLRERAGMQDAEGYAHILNGRVSHVTMTNFGDGYTLPVGVNVVGHEGSGTGFKGSAIGLGFRVHFPLTIYRMDAIESDMFEERTRIDLTVDYAEVISQDTGLIDIVDCELIMGDDSDTGQIAL